MTIRRLVQAALNTAVGFCVLAIGSSTAWAGSITEPLSTVVVSGYSFTTPDNIITFSNFTTNIPFGAPSNPNDVNIFWPATVGSANEYKVALVPSTGTPLVPGGGPYVFSFEMTVDPVVGSPDFVDNVGVGIDGAASTDTKVITVGGSTIGSVETGPTYPNPAFIGIGSQTTLLVTETIVLSATATDPVASVTSVTDYFEEGTVPEPATFSLIGGALMGLGLLGRKRLFRA